MIIIQVQIHRHVINSVILIASGLTKRGNGLSLTRKHGGGSDMPVTSNIFRKSTIQMTGHFTVA